MAPPRLSSPLLTGAPPLFAPGDPFVLFEDARSPAGAARLYAAPSGVIVARSLAEVRPALEALRAALRQGRHAAGWLSYEAGLALEPRLAARGAPPAQALPLLWFGLFDAPAPLTRARVAALLPDPAGAWLSVPRPRVSRAAYAAAFDRAHAHIVSGDIYQLNLSYRADVTLLGDPCAAYARLRQSGQGGWSALVHDGAAHLLSASPELFFQIESGRITARPMKGTAPRGATPDSDRAAAEALRANPKEQAENLMIVDLLRNDISRIAARDSVRVPALFSVETYPTLHTLTSTIEAEIRPDRDAVDALLALFPCGSITGAPKVRAMEIIADLETDARGAYTGAIGWLAPDGAAAFNVAIRTLAVTPQGAELGLGAAIVYDSTAAQEWEECALKGAFLTTGAPVFGLIETMRAEHQRVALLDLHLARLHASAAAFNYPHGDLRAAIEAAAAQTREACILRAVLAADGALSIETRPLPPAAAEARVALAPLPVSAADVRLRHKTTLRDFYDSARVPGTFDTIFTDPDGFITEGSFTNVFLERGGRWLTPPLTRGLLPGVLRQSLLASGRAIEADLRPEDLRGGFHLGNAVRGLIPARLA